MSADGGALPALVAWRTQLGLVRDFGRALRDAIARRDLLAAIGAAAALRGARAALARVEPPGALRGDAAELTALADLEELIAGARDAAEVMARWMARPRPGDAELLGSPLGVAVLAEGLLPAVWDHAVDVVVLLGAPLAPVADVLVALGGKRVVVLDRSDADADADAGADPAPASVGAPAILARDDDELLTALRTMTPCPPGHMVVSAAAGTPREEVARVGELVRAALSDLRIHRNTVRTFSPTWLAQGMANAAAVARSPSIAAADDALRGLPMVIVAPGPSLARNAHLLRELRGRAVIAAFSHSLRPVLAAGVTPDVVVSVDPQDVRYHFAGCDVSRSHLVNAVTVHPSLFELPAAGFLTMSANCEIDDWMLRAFDENATAPGGGSVATTALSLALRWGCDPIVFVGLDLSFPGGAYYVGTSVDGGARAELDARGHVRVAGWSDGFRAMKAAGGPAAREERTVELPGWHGGTVPSSFMFSMFHRWFVERLADVRGPTVFNCTEGGAFIEGMLHRPLADVLAELPHGVDGAARLAAVVRSADGGARTAQLVAHFAELLRGLRRCRRLAARARVLAAARSGAVDEARLVEVEAELAAATAPLGFASLLAQRELEHAHDAAHRDGDADGYRAASVALFETLITVAGRLEPILREALARLRPLPAARRSHGRAA